MRNYRKISKAAVSEAGESGGLSSEVLQLKKRILQNRKRAIRVGVLYILGVILLAVSALILPIPARNTMGVLFVLDMLPTVGTAEITELAKLALYLIMVVVTLVNVIRAFKRKDWLKKKTATLEYGFNRNVYAMFDLGHIFSGSLTVFALNGFLLMVLAKVRLTTNLMFLGLLAVALLIHFIGGVKGAKASFFDIDNDEVVEEARKIGRFAPFFRNFMQVGCILAIMWGFLRVNYRLDAVETFGVALYAAIPCLIVLIKHAFGIAEYDMDGVKAKGMKVSRIFFFLTAVVFAVVGIGAFTAYMDAVTSGTDAISAFVDMSEPNRSALFTFGVAFFMCILELIMRKHPKLKAVEEESSENEAKESEAKEESVDENNEVVEEKKSKKEIKKEKKLAKKQAKAEKKAEKKANKLVGELALDATLENAGHKSANAESVEESTETVSEETVEQSVETVGSVAPMGMPMAPMNPMAPMAPIASVPFSGTPSAQVNVMAPSQGYPMSGYPQIIPIPYPMPMYMPQQPTPPAQPAVPSIPVPPTNMAMSNASMLPLLAGMSILPVLNGLGNSMNASALARSNNGVLPSQLMQEAVANKKAGKKGGMDFPFMDEAEYRKPTKAEKKAWEMIEKAPVVTPIDDVEVDVAQSEAPVKVDVNCPFCKRKLTVKSTSHYNRCPACRKVFQLHKSN